MKYQTSNQSNGNGSNVMTTEEIYDAATSYSQAQLYLANRKFTPYPDGRGGVEDSICKTHAAYSCKLMKEQELRHGLHFHAEIQSLKHNEESYN